MDKNELDFPVVYDGEKSIGYGGNQDWFPKLWQQRSGCGATSGASVSAYLAANLPGCEALYSGNTEKFQRAEFVAHMDLMFSMMTPGLYGYPYAGRFAREFVKFAAQRGVSVTATGCGKLRTDAEGLAFVKDSIDKGYPIPLLILLHRAKELADDRWHWVTITGYEKDADGDDVIIFSDCGERSLVKSKILFEVCCQNVIRMLAIRPQ